MARVFARRLSEQGSLDAACPQAAMLPRFKNSYNCSNGAQKVAPRDTSQNVSPARQQLTLLRICSS
jgi:hypothetical protein